jgi:hypothetical protein
MYSNKYLLIFLWYINNSMCVCSEINMCSYIRGMLYMLHVCIHTPWGKHMHPHIHFGSYIIKILKVKIEERRETIVSY